MAISFWLIIPFFLAIVVLVFVGMLFAMRRREQEIAWLDKHGILMRQSIIRKPLCLAFFACISSLQLHIDLRM
jgi:hypothetical protein